MQQQEFAYKSGWPHKCAEGVVVVVWWWCGGTPPSCVWCVVRVCVCVCGGGALSMLSDGPKRCRMPVGRWCRVGGCIKNTIRGRCVGRWSGLPFPHQVVRALPWADAWCDSSPPQGKTQGQSLRTGLVAHGQPHFLIFFLAKWFVPFIFTLAFIATTQSSKW